MATAMFLVFLCIAQTSFVAAVQGNEALENTTAPVCTEFDNTIPDPLTAMDYVPVCIVVSNRDTSWKTAFYTQVDEFTLLEVDNSWTQPNDFWGTNLFVSEDTASDFTIHIEINGSRSSMLRVQTNDHQVPYWTITAMLDAGVLNTGADTVTFASGMDLPTPFVWDNDGGDGCFGDCIESNCADGFCAVDRAGGPGGCGNGEGEIDCDLKIYLGWYGTDSSGSYLTSASKRLSAFRSWSVKEVFQSAASMAIDNAPNPDSLIDGIVNLP